jgi:mannose-6-phosphate isomerase
MAGGFDPSSFLIMPYQKRVEKPWGYEIIYTKDTAPATGKLLHVNAGKRLSLQYHDTKVETLCLIKGEAVITISNERDATVDIPMELFKGYEVVPGQVHRVTAVTDIEFVEASTPEKGNTYRLQDDVGRTTETEHIRNETNRGWNIK